MRHDSTRAVTMQTHRLDAIRHHLYAQGASSIQALADAIGASAATVRRDLQVLEQQGVVSRTHGGARIAHGADVEVAFEVRENLNLAAKRAIADAAFETIEPHGAVFLDAGTTVLQLVRRLRVSPMPLTVVTNGLTVAQELMTIPKLKVMLLGGQVRVENASVVGPAAESALDRLWFDHLFLGASAIGDDRRVYSVDVAEASLNALMQGRAAVTTILADASKFGRRATYAVSDLRAPTRVITDEALSPERRAALREAGVRLTTVQPFAAPGPRLAFGGSA